MKKLFLFCSLFVGIAFSTMSMAQDTHVDGYYNNSGSYVQPHYRSAPDGNSYNNYSTQGNTNPYTGQKGYQTPSYNQQQPNFGSQQQRNSFGSPRQSLGGNGRPGSMY